MQFLDSSGYPERTQQVLSPSRQLCCSCDHSTMDLVRAQQVSCFHLLEKLLVGLSLFSLLDGRWHAITIIDEINKFLPSLCWIWLPFGIDYFVRLGWPLHAALPARSVAIVWILKSTNLRIVKTQKIAKNLQFFWVFDVFSLAVASRVITERTARNRQGIGS